MSVSGLPSVVLAVAVLCGLLSVSEQLRTTAGNQPQFRPGETRLGPEATRHGAADQQETRHGAGDRQETRHGAGDRQETRHGAGDRQETRHGAGDRQETRPARLTSERDSVADVGTRSSLSSAEERSLRIKRTPLLISRIGKYRREKGTEAAETERYQPEDTTNAELSRFGLLQSNEEEPALTGITQLQNTGPARNPSFVDSNGAYQLEITTKPDRFGETDHQLESSRAASGVSTTGEDTPSDTLTEHQSEISPEPDGNDRNTGANDVTAEAASSDLTERLQDISSRIQLVRQKLSQRFSSEMRQNGGGNSLVTLAILALGVLLFDAINDALAAGGGGGGRDAGGLWDRLLGPELWRWSAAPDRWDQLLADLSAEEASAGREVLLPGPGLIGDYINSLLEIGLNMITVWMHGEAGSQCGRRLLCELNQRALSQSSLHSALTYAGGLLLSLLLPEAPASDHLLAMRQGRRGADCLATFNRCHVTL